MGLHKLTAGTGYLYLIRQVAAQDRTHGRDSLGDYYSSKGETPGRWGGRGLAGLAAGEDRFVATDLSAPLWRVEPGSEVTEDQMLALFGLGVHPNAKALAPSLMAQTSKNDALKATKLGKQFQVNVGETPLRQRLAEAYRDYNAERGEHWDAPIEESVRAQMRTRISLAMFEEEHGRAPADERELTGFVARGTRELTTSVAGYDLTFTPVKSVAALHALAPMPIAERIEDCHQRALNDALEMLQDSAAYTRVGAQGVAQVDTEGFIYTAFTHRDTRASDPGLHTHVAVSNKVRARGADGVWRWYALDGRPLYAANVTASELYNTRLEAYLGQELGLVFTERGGAAPGKREVREVSGVSPELIALWSSRRAAINAEHALLAKKFQTEHGREPTNAESIALFQQANLATRAAKHEPRSQAEQRQQWRSEAVACLGSEQKVNAMMAGCLSQRAPRSAEVTEEWVDAQAAAVISTVSASRATWRRTNVAAEAQRRIRATGHAAVEGLAERITEVALSEPHSIAHARTADGDLGEPAVLRRRDGSSVFRQASTASYTSTELVAAEARILAAAEQVDGRTVNPAEVDLALVEQAANRRELNAGQAELVRRMASSGQRVMLALAPAGSGKTTAMAALSRAWEGSGGTVIGLSPSANAAQLLRAEIEVEVADTVDKFTWLHNNPGAGAADPARQWFDAIDESTLLIVDEAGKAGTLALDSVIAIALARGASVRLIGDDRQLSSISAGGVLRDLAHNSGAITLSQVMRFVSPAEAQAGLALREGDPAGIAHYLDNQRVHVGAEVAAIDMAFAAWSQDIDAGEHSLLLAPTHEVVDELNQRARLARLHALGDAAPSDEVQIAGGSRASVGDVVFTKKNARHLGFGPNDFVRNGYRWEVGAVDPDGSMTVCHLDSKTHLHIPADYVRTHVSLGYATTIDAAQGATAGYRCHTVGSDSLTREQVYTALSRGRYENHIYFSTAEHDPHRVLAPKATHPDTAVDVLTRALARQGAQVSATTVARESADPALRLAFAAATYSHAVGSGAEQLLTPAEHRALDREADKLLPGLTDATAWPVLRQHLCLIAAHGYHPIKKLAATINAGGFDNAADPAAVIDWRLDPTGTHSGGSGPLPWLPAIPSRLRNDDKWGTYLARRAELIGTLEREVRAASAEWNTASAPRWARPIVDTDPALAADLAVYRAATGVEEPDTRIAGATQYPARLRASQSQLENRAVGVIGDQTQTRRYDRLVDSIDPHIRRDPFWPQLATHLAQAARTGVDVDQLVTTAAGSHPLPDELPAAALWWRLSGTLSPAIAETAAHSALAEPDTILAAASAEAQALREQYQGARTELAALESAVARRRGPACEHLDAEALAQLRDRAEADRPYLAAVEAVIDQWNDAETLYATAEALIAHAQTQLHALQAQPDADPLDVASAAQHLAWLQTNVRPTQSPAEQFYPALQKAIADREQAAGTDQITTHAEVDALLAQAAAADDALLREHRAELKALHARLSAAETAAAEAFATAQLRTADHITAQLPTMHTELRILDAAGHPSFTSVLNIPDPALDALDPPQCDALSALAATAFAVTPAYAPDRPVLHEQMQILAHTAADAGRQIIWASTTTPDTDDHSALAADVTEVNQLHITPETTAPGTLIVIDHAEHLHSDKLANLAEDAAATESRIILLDTDSRPPTASATMLAALHKDLPWSQTLTSTTPRQRAHTPITAQSPDRHTALTQARGLSPAHHTPDITAALTRYDQLLTNHRRAHDTHTQIRGITLKTVSRDQGRSR
ncbi:MAG: relaxase domain-containing protein [Actinomycetia bacterium]|nr:relaxase domain-containing protein [Actinomycetes bacterium]